MVEQQHQVAQVAAHAPNCRAYTGSIYTYIYIVRHAREEHVRCERTLSLSCGCQCGTVQQSTEEPTMIVSRKGISFRRSEMCMLYVPVGSCTDNHHRRTNMVLLSKSKHERNTEARNNVTRACVADRCSTNQAINDPESRVPCTVTEVITGRIHNITTMKKEGIARTVVV